ncbi:hypothetical protein MRB53_037131 [Persea americana]|nr:hypothetical protein MRB53_037131 [Persea americana]
MRVRKKGGATPQAVLSPLSFRRSELISKDRRDGRTKEADRVHAAERVKLSGTCYMIRNEKRRVATTVVDYGDAAAVLELIIQEASRGRADGARSCRLVLLTSLSMEDCSDVVGRMNGSLRLREHPAAGSGAYAGNVSAALFTCAPLGYRSTLLLALTVIVLAHAEKHARDTSRLMKSTFQQPRGRSLA